MTVKYWGFLLLKLLAGGLVMRVLWGAILLGFRSPVLYLGVEQKPFGHDLGYTSAMLLFFLACFGVMYLIIWDQRYRCRSCLRRLRMPLATGSWPNMFLIGTRWNSIAKATMACGQPVSSARPLHPGRLVLEIAPCAQLVCT